MVLGQANRVDSTLLDSTRWHAVSMLAYIRVRAIGVRFAARLISCDGLAVLVDIGYGVGWALADHRSQWDCVQHCAALVG
jgi:hypothetical protein